MLLNTGTIGLRLSLSTSARHAARSPFCQITVPFQRSFSHRTIQRPRIRSLTKEPPPSSSTSSSSSCSSSFFTPSLCRTTRSYALTSANPSSSAQTTLDWNTFFQLRKSRRRYALASSVVTAFATTAGTFVLLSTQAELADQVTKLIPTDPVVSLGILTFGATLLGWLLGPVFGTGVWRLLHRARSAEFASKEKAFYERIKKYRVNPRGANTNNPVPDFYGEKISSVSGYRRWLKDQRAFNRKRNGDYSQQGSQQWNMFSTP